MSEANFQYSDKIGDSGIFVVRGNDYVDFSNNLQAIVTDQEFAQDMQQLAEAIRGVSVGHTQAVNNVQAAMPAASNQGGTMNAGQTFSCPHGPRTFKEGRKKNGGMWSAYFCNQKGSDCKPMNPDGSLWS